MWFHSLHCLVYLFTASLSLSTDTVPVILSVTRTLRARQGGRSEEDWLQHLDWVVHTDSEPQVMYFERKKEHITRCWRDGLVPRETEWPLKASLSKAVSGGSVVCRIGQNPSPFPPPLQISLVSLSHRFAAQLGERSEWSRKLFSHLETCTSKVAVVWTLISVCWCDIIYFVFNHLSHRLNHFCHNFILNYNRKTDYVDLMNHSHTF